MAVVPFALRVSSTFKLTLTLNVQVEASYKSVSHTGYAGGFKKYITDQFRKKGILIEMLQNAYGTGHEQGLSKKTLEKMEKKRCFQTDHILGCNCDGSFNFFFMFQSLNNQFSFQTLQQFKKFYTGTAWDGIVSYVDKAYQMQWSYGRRF